jgi:ribosomal protein L21
MSKYAVIKVGSSQERVSVGDEFSVSSSFEEETVVPVLVSPRKGQIVVDDKELKNYKVEQELDIERTLKLLKLRVFRDLKALRRNNV